MTDRSVLRMGAVGAAVAVLTLVAMVLVPWPFDFAFPGAEVIAGQLELAPADFDRYVAVLQVHFAIDSIFIMAWIVGWLGIAALVRTRNRLIGDVALVLGMVGPLLDFGENKIVWALVEGQQQGIPAQAGWYLAWKVVRQLSYLIPFAAAAVAAMGLWSKKPLDRVMSGLGTAFVALAVAGLYVPALSLLADLWWLLWFACGALLLWRRAAE